MGRREGAGKAGMEGGLGWERKKRKVSKAGFKGSQVGFAVRGIQARKDRESVCVCEGSSQTEQSRAVFAARHPCTAVLGPRS